MDQNLKELCIAVINDNVASDSFTHLIVETGIRLDSPEWDMANRMLVKRDEIRTCLGSTQYTKH